MLPLKQISELLLGYLIYNLVTKSFNLEYPDLLTSVQGSHLSYYSAFNFIINVFKFLRGEHYLGCFWESFLQDTHLLSLGTACEVLTIFYSFYAQWDLLMIALTYKFFLVQVIKFLQLRSLLPINVTWFLWLKDSLWLKEDSESNFSMLTLKWRNILNNWKELISVLALVLCLQLMQWRITVNIPSAEIVERPDITHYEENFQHLILKSRNVINHTLVTLQILQNMFQWKNRWWLKELMIIGSLIIQVQLEVLSVHHFHILTQNNFASINNIRPGKKSAKFVRSLILRITLFNYLVLKSTQLLLSPYFLSLFLWLQNLMHLKEYFWHLAFFINDKNRLGPKWKHKDVNYLYNALSISY